METVNLRRRYGESPLRIRLFARGFAPSGAEDVPASVYDRLQRLETEGAIADCEVEVWGRKVCRRLDDDRPAIADATLDTIDEFHAWADRTDASLDRYFDESEVHSDLMGTDRTEIRLPMVCLAVYDAHELVAVFPHATSDDEYTVADGLATLESSERRLPRGPATISH